MKTALLILPPVEEIKAILEYDPITGIFIWPKTRPGLLGGKRPGTLCNGYLKIFIKGRIYFAHRLAWKISYSEEPPDVLDHVNGIRNDNRLENLRAASPAENTRNKGMMKNNTSGATGVVFREKAKKKKWRAQIRSDGKTIHLGSFASREDAAAAYKSAARVHHGEFTRAS